MTKKKFEKLLTKHDYCLSKSCLSFNVDFDVWEKQTSNILIEVRNRTFVRIIQFLDGTFGYIESLPFSQNSSIY